jgi:hypothetical protein
VFRPPFCPQKDCHYHMHPPRSRWCHKVGFHKTVCFGLVPRFKCLGCMRTFSSQTFSTNYYVKHVINYAHLEHQLASSASVRATARH